ncbi:MAG: hypothetical protein RRA32_00740 [bacterium]|nr:hypothetical protein [bacterium]
MRKESTVQVVAPAIVFALVMHLVFRNVFMADLSTPWLLLVLGVQSLLLTAWAFENVTYAFAVMGAALAALLIDGFAAVRGAVEAGSIASLPFIGAAASSLLIVAALYTSYHLATSPGYWFAHRLSSSSRSGQPVSAPFTPTGKTASVPASPALPQPRAATVQTGQAPGAKKMSNLFRIHHARTGELLLTCPREQVGQGLNIRSLRNLLADYDPETLRIVQVAWVHDTAVDIHVEGELKGAGKDHYTLLDLEE